MSRIKLICWLLVLVLLTAGTLTFRWRAGLRTKLYTATAYLKLESPQPTILVKICSEHEFEIFREAQKSLITSRLVIMAALRDPKLKNRACIPREDAKHDAFAWLTDQIKVGVPPECTCLMFVSATEHDPEDAAAVVNAVVNAYMNKIVNFRREEMLVRLTDLQKSCAEKEDEVRIKRKRLSRELETKTQGPGSAGKLSVAAQLVKTDIDDLEHVLRGAADERERLRIEIRSVPRVEILGDPIAPAAVPESPD